MGLEMSEEDEETYQRDDEEADMDRKDKIRRRKHAQRYEVMKFCFHKVRDHTEYDIGYRLEEYMECVQDQYSELKEWTIMI
jgi:hypothetical protein